MSRLMTRVWDVPQLEVDHAEAGSEELEEAGILDPGPLGLVAARIQLFDGGERRAGARGPLTRANRAALEEEKWSRTLGYQARKVRKAIPDPSGLPPASSLSLLGSDSPPESRNRSRLSHLFGSSQGAKESEKVEELYQRLTSFSVYGLPRLPDEIRDAWKIGEGVESRIQLPDSWKDVVEGHEGMSRKQSHQQEAIWELLQTEVIYLKKLKIVTDLFIVGLLNLQWNGILLEVDLRLLCGNIQEIVQAHRSMWWEVMAPVLDKARVSGCPLDPVLLCRGFQTLPNRLHSYVSYCLSESRSLQYSYLMQQKNKLFAMYVKWAETHKQSYRMRLNDMLVKPHQRLTKYPLLLKAILKKTEEATAKDALHGTIVIVEKFIRSINSQMQVREEEQKLAAIANLINKYDVVEFNNDETERIVKEFSALDLTVPMLGIGPQCVRSLLLEGSLKMKDGRDGKTEVHCLLFTDVFLITKAHRKGTSLKVIRQPLMLDRVISRELKDPGSFVLVYLSELQSLVALFTFQAPNAGACKEWIQTLTAAQKQLHILRSKETWVSPQGPGASSQADPEIPEPGPSPPGMGPSARGDSLQDKAGEAPEIPASAAAPSAFHPAADAETVPPRPGVTPQRRGPHRTVGAQRVIDRRLRAAGARPRGRRPQIRAQASGLPQEREGDEEEQEEEGGCQIQSQASGLPLEREGNEQEEEGGCQIQSQASGLPLEQEGNEQEEEGGSQIQSQASGLPSEREGDEAGDSETKAQASGLPWEQEEGKGEGYKIQCQDSGLLWDQERGEVDGYQIQAQASGLPWETEGDEAEGPETQAQASGLLWEREGDEEEEEGPESQAQASGLPWEREGDEEEPGPPARRLQGGERSGSDTALNPVQETLRRAKAMESRATGAGPGDGGRTQEQDGVSVRELHLNSTSTTSEV